MAGLLRRGLAVIVLIATLVSPAPSQKITLPSTLKASQPDTNLGKARELPRIILWAWERREQLDFIDPKTVAVAFLASTVYLNDGGAIVRPRLQPMIVPRDTQVIAVVRIESSAGSGRKLTAESRRRAVNAVVEASRLPRIVGVQVDFDARKSERQFYRELINDIRAELPRLPLSITALASWCTSDNWISDLPIDDAIPMLFRMGTGTLDTQSFLLGGRDFKPAICQNSVGVSTDEPLSAVPRKRRVFIFHPKPWSQTAVLRALQAAEQLQ